MSIKPPYFSPKRSFKMKKIFRMPEMRENRIVFILILFCGVTEILMCTFALFIHEKVPHIDNFLYGLCDKEKCGEPILKVSLIIRIVTDILLILGALTVFVFLFQYVFCFEIYAVFFTHFFFKISFHSIFIFIISITEYQYTNGAMVFSHCNWNLPTFTTHRVIKVRM